MPRPVLVETVDILYDANKRIVGESRVMHDGSVVDRIIERDTQGRVTRVTDTRREPDDGPIMLTPEDMVDDGPLVQLTAEDMVGP